MMETWPQQRGLTNILHFLCRRCVYFVVAILSLIHLLGSRNMILFLFAHNLFILFFKFFSSTVICVHCHPACLHHTCFTICFIQFVTSFLMQNVIFFYFLTQLLLFYYLSLEFLFRRGSCCTQSFSFFFATNLLEILTQNIDLKTVAPIMMI